MNFKSFISFALFILFFSGILHKTFAETPSNTPTYKLYGFVRNDFYYNSRKNAESLDGIFSIYPKPIELNADGTDKNAVPYAEMLSIATRLGLDFSGSPILGASSSAKIECDFAGTSSTYFLVRLRQAYLKLNWTKSELLVGQTWHPMFGNVMPTVLGLNTGAPFQPFNRSPQVRFKQELASGLSLTAAAIYQMQYMSQGPLEASTSYMKSALLPNLFAGIENKNQHWTIGAGVDTKTIKPDKNTITSVSGIAYSQYSQKKFTIKAKAVWGQNLTDLTMLGGYGVSGTDSNGAYTYTNLNNLSSWLNIVYGTKFQLGILGGLSVNMGANKPLLSDTNGKYTAYGTGFFQSQQIINNRLVRVAPHLIYNLPNFRLGIEYEFMSADYGNIENTGKASDIYTVNNHRAVASISYIF